MPGKDGGKKKSLKAPTEGKADLDESDVVFKKKQAEEKRKLAALKTKLISHSNQASFFKPDQESKITINSILNKEYLDTHSCLSGCYTWAKTIEITEKEERLYTDKFDDHGMRLCPLMPCVIFSVLDDSHIEFQIKIAKDDLIKAFSNPKYNSDGSIKIRVDKPLNDIDNGDYREDICSDNGVYPTHRAVEMTFLNDKLTKIAISNYPDGVVLPKDVRYESGNLTSNNEHLNRNIKKK